MTKETGGPAFPHEAHGPNLSTWTEPGMTLRDYFAAQSLGVARTFISEEIATKVQIKAIVEEAYKMADAMLEARK